MSNKTKNWTEEEFRRELRRIDEHVVRTEGIALHGADLEIILSNTTSRNLGTYFLKERKFQFSLMFFNSDIPESCAIDIIRHEYAHYYADVVMGAVPGHNKEFKAACKSVGANPKRLYTREFEQSERRKETAAEKVYSSCYKVSQQVVHPVFGKGKISAIECKKDTALLTVNFEKHGIKKIDEVWLKDHSGSVSFHLRRGTLP